jgi:hypothetical protein
MTNKTKAVATTATNGAPVKTLPVAQTVEVRIAHFEEMARHAAARKRFVKTLGEIRSIVEDLKEKSEESGHDLEDHNYIVQVNDRYDRKVFAVKNSLFTLAFMEFLETKTKLRIEELDTLLTM